MFASNFRNASINQIQILFDSNKQIFRIFRSNINDVQDLQVDQWSRNYIAKGYGDDPQKFKTALGALLGSFRNVQTVDKDGSYLAFTPENFQIYFATMFCKIFPTYTFHSFYKCISISIFKPESALNIKKYNV